MFLGSFQTGCLVSVTQATRPVFPAGERIAEPKTHLTDNANIKWRRVSFRVKAVIYNFESKKDLFCNVVGKCLQKS